MLERALLSWACARGLLLKFCTIHRRRQIGVWYVVFGEQLYSCPRCFTSKRGTYEMLIKRREKKEIYWKKSLFRPKRPDL